MYKKILNTSISVLLILTMLFCFSACQDSAPQATQAPVTEAPLATQAPTEAPTEVPTPTPITEFTVNDAVDSEESIVSIFQSDDVADCHDFTYEQIFALVEKSIQAAGGLDGIVKDGDVVVLKPNIVTYHDDTEPGYRGKDLTPEVNGNSTDWRVMKATASIIKKINPSGKIYCIEGSSDDTSYGYELLHYDEEHIPEIDGFFTLEDDFGPFRDTDEDFVTKVNLEDGIYQNEYYLNKIIYECDAYISVATLKNHWHAIITGAVKNIGIGSTPTTIYGGGERNLSRFSMVNHESSQDLHKWIADFYYCRPADFAIMDGLQGIENGPTPCYDIARITDITTCQKNMRLILASKDAVALDTVCANIMEWNVDTVLYLQYLASDEYHDIGNVLCEKIRVVGNRIVDDVRTEFVGVTSHFYNEAKNTAKLTDLTAPKVTAITSSYSDNKLNVSFTIDDTSGRDFSKAEVYLKSQISDDYIYVGKITESANGEGSGTFNVTGLLETYTVKVVVFDAYMNHSELIK